MPTDFPSRVRSERTRLGLTQQQAAELLGVRQQTYHGLETRPNDPRLSTLTRLIGAGFRLTVLAPELSGRRDQS
jgi:DNA-binding XRE family transcriptional regulator